MGNKPEQTIGPEPLLGLKTIPIEDLRRVRIMRPEPVDVFFLDKPTILRFGSLNRLATLLFSIAGIIAGYALNIAQEVYVLGSVDASRLNSSKQIMVTGFVLSILVGAAGLAPAVARWREQKRILEKSTEIKTIYRSSD